VESNKMTTEVVSTPCTARLRSAISALVEHPMGGNQIERTSTTSGRVAVLAGGYGAFQGTGVSTGATTTAQLGAKATVMLPIRDAVVVSGFAGLRSWSPPV
jgi:hypothetical protein